RATLRVAFVGVYYTYPSVFARIAGMTTTEARRRKIRENLDSGKLLRDFDVTQDIAHIGTPPPGTVCAGCGEKFSPSDPPPIARFGSGQKYWFHQECEKLWQEERHRPRPRRK